MYQFQLSSRNQAGSKSGSAVKPSSMSKALACTNIDPPPGRESEQPSYGLGDELILIHI